MVGVLVMVLGPTEGVRDQLLKEFILPAFKEAGVELFPLEKVKGKDPLFADNVAVFALAESWGEAMPVVNSVPWGTLLVISSNKGGRLHIEGANSEKGVVFEIKTSTAFKRLTRSVIKDILTEYFVTAS